MVNREIAIITTIATIMISISVTYFPFFQAQGASAKEACIGPCHHGLPIVTTAGANMTTGSNMTGAAGNTSGAAHGSSIHTTNPAAYSTQSTQGSGPSMRNVK
jgi:hypothetical protein